ncbi:hypothetical protein F5887DRAFT_1210317 [Amanita rubescens]|nr:hypothetical protein F5887DRAFT_1210317 [Amanita rubescens]
MQWRPLKSERWKSSKRRTAKQKNQLANLHAKHHPNDENIPPPQELPTTPSNSSHTGGVDALANQLDVLKDRAITYERKYRNERKRNARKEMALMSLKNQYSSLSTEHKDYQDQLQHLHSHHGKLTKQNHALVMPQTKVLHALDETFALLEPVDDQVPKQRAKAISGRDGEDELVREIGRAGREWSKRFWRKEDMTVYLWRLISEIARLSGEKDGRDDLDVS